MRAREARLGNKRETRDLPMGGRPGEAAGTLLLLLPCIRRVMLATSPFKACVRIREGAPGGGDEKRVRLPVAPSHFRVESSRCMHRAPSAFRYLEFVLKEALLLVS